MTLAGAVKPRIVVLVVGVKSEGCPLVCGQGGGYRAPLHPLQLALCKDGRGMGMRKLGSENECHAQVVSGWYQSV